MLFCSSLEIISGVEEEELQRLSVTGAECMPVYDVSLDSTSLAVPFGCFWFLDRGISRGREALLGLRLASSMGRCIRGVGQLWAFL